MPYLLSCDIHTHTMFSAHAYSTIEENVYWAAERGLQVLGSADHLSSMVTACPNDLRGYQFFINQDIWPRIWSGVLVLRGAEVDIVSLDEACLARTLLSRSISPAIRTAVSIHCSIWLRVIWIIWLQACIIRRLLRTRR